MKFTCRWPSCFDTALTGDYCFAHESVCKWPRCSEFSGLEDFCITHENTCKWSGCSEFSGLEDFCITHERTCRARGCGQHSDWEKFCWDHLAAKECGERFPLIRVIGRHNDLALLPHELSDQNSWVYLIERANQQKIGITRNPNRRLKIEHFGNGWFLIELRGPIPIELSRFVETRILQTLKFKGVRLGSEVWSEYFDGYTETWPTRDLRVKSIAELLPQDITAADLGNKTI